MADDRFYFRQLLSGRDFAVGDAMAEQMVNFVYAVGDRAKGECVLIDPAYAVNELIDMVEAAAARGGLDGQRPRLMDWLARIHARRRLAGDGDLVGGHPQRARNGGITAHVENDGAARRGDAGGESVGE